MQVVPRGTNGGISLLGTGAGVAGGIFMGVVYWLAGITSTGWARSDMTWAAALAAGALLGLVGTLLDSLLGATLQHSSFVGGIGQVASRPHSDGQHITGADVLSNDAVNFLAVNATAALALLVPL